MSMQKPPGASPGPWGILVRVAGIVVAAALAGVLVAMMFLPFVGGVGVVARDVIKDFQSLPDSLSTPPLPQRTLILASDGSVLATLYYQNRVEIPLENISPFMRQATVSIEDARFLDHNGVDVRGILRSLATNVEQGQIEQGSSTLTMQYVKNVLVNEATTADDLDAARGDSAARKLREVRYALGLEKLFSKADILERYLNIAYFGAGAYGVEAASRRYFSKPAANLGIAGAATLAGIVQQPPAYGPLRNPELSTTRRNVVLKRMADLGYISRVQADRAS
ncbi:MAG: transglycosylase domain-containing protein, partial [Candidatus Nanopelagicales bacterium]|nr:transglycosylase domain-containing protein [Candidatus Nanopelagicales bacterium]